MVYKKGSISASEGSQDYGIRIEDDRIANGMAHDAKEDSSKASANSDQSHQKSPKSSINGNNLSSKHSPPQSTKNTRHLPGDSDDDKVSEIAVKKGDCCISVGEKIIIKQKLNEEDKPSDFTLVDGSIYIRKSAVDTGSTKNAAAQSGVPKISEPVELRRTSELSDIHEEVEPGSKEVQVTNIKECILCCKHLKCGLKDLLHLCDSDPDAFIRQYEERNAQCGIQDENSDGDFAFQMDKTHGSVFGDEKYHYLMVDKSTLLNEEIPKTEEGPGLPSVPTQISVHSKTVSKKSARLVIEEPEKKPAVPTIFLNQIPRFESVEDTRSSYENIIPAKVASAEEIVPAKVPAFPETFAEDLRTVEEDKLSSNATLILKHPSVNDMQDIASTSVELNKDSTSNKSKTEEPDYTHRISIIWDDAVDPISKVVKAPSNDGKEKRVSAVSFSGVDTDKFAEIAKKSIQRPEQTNINKNSIFEDIVKSERMKNSDYKSRSRVKSLIEQPADSTVQKKKWFGLVKPKKQTDSGSSQPVRQSAIVRKSVIDSVVTDVEEAESTYLLKEPASEEKAGVPGSTNRNSLEAYRRRSVPVERPVFEKHREINDYLHNI